jgi:RES domain-containing protein
MFPGRWNSAGVSVVYAAASISLAILEVLVHLREATTMPDYLLIEARFDESLLAVIDESQLPPNWRRDPAPKTLKQFGDDWIMQQRSVVLRVPSSITGEPNYLLNPLHPQFQAVQIGTPQALVLDPRLLPESLLAKPGRKRRR